MSKYRFVNLEKYISKKEHDRIVENLENKYEKLYISINKKIILDKERSTGTHLVRSLLIPYIIFYKSNSPQEVLDSFPEYLEEYKKMELVQEKVKEEWEWVNLRGAYDFNTCIGIELYRKDLK